MMRAIVALASARLDDARRDAADLLFARRGRSRRRARHGFVAAAAARTDAGGLLDSRQRRAAAGRHRQLRRNLAERRTRVRPQRERRRRAARSVAGGQPALTAELHPGDQSALVTFDTVVSLPCPLSAIRLCVRRCAERGDTGARDGPRGRGVCGHDDRRIRCRPIAADGVQRRARYGELPRYRSRARHGATLRRRRVSNRVQRRAAGFSRGAGVVNRRTAARSRGATTICPTTFRAILDEFRHRYLVTYTPKNVPKDGWHKLEVQRESIGCAGESAPWIPGRLITSS